MTLLGIPDPAIWLAYLLCIASALFAGIYGFINWNKGDETVSPDDVKWVQDEKAAEEDL